MTKKIFLAFPGFEVGVEKIEKLSTVKLFNLNSISEADFINLINKEIKPFNKNVVRNNKNDFAKLEFKKSYSSSNWGISLPIYGKESSLAGIYEARYLMKLFSGSPLPVMFSVGSMGVDVRKTGISTLEKAMFHGEDKNFFNNDFLSFYKILFPIIQKSGWDAIAVAKWSLEDWRLCAACVVFDDLEKYYRSKRMMTWQSECADLASFYEMLFSRRKNDGGIYKITQRLSVLLGNSFSPQMKKDLSLLYNYRNEFVHGSFFERLKRSTKTYPDDNNMAQLPNLDYKFLSEQANLARKIFIIYLYLVKKLSKGRLAGQSVSQIIHDGIMDVKSRKQIQKYANEILTKM
ncbi:MAG: hypothetical protein WC682_05370 [Parcubacteria group bacterium]|jgi:hypothetical protein